jgi:hypothetical protein
MRITISIGDNELVRQLWEGGGIQVTAVDLLYAGEREKTRILNRTLKGLDYLNRPFAPYSRNGPYYYYPQSGGYRAERAAISFRFQARLGDGGGKLTKSGIGIKFADYESFKKGLGRMNVDLTGPRAPHMLQSLAVQVQGNRLIIGIWGAEEAKAEGHNEGIRGRLPQRRFLDLGPESVEAIGQDVADSMAVRLSGDLSQMRQSR